MLTTDVENYPGLPRRRHGPRHDGEVPEAGRALRHARAAAGHHPHRVLRRPDRQPPHAAHEQGRDGPGPRGDRLDRRDRQLAGPRERAASRPDRRRRERLRRLRRRPADVPGGPLAVVGGGDTAMEEATFLTKFASKVYVIHRRDELRASKVMQERLLSKPNAEVLWNKTVVDCLSAPDHLGNDKLTALVLEDTKTGERSELEVKGFFVAIGHTPATKFLRAPGSRSTTRATSSSRAVRARPICRASSPRAMSRTRRTARRSPPRAWAARRRSTPSTGWARTTSSDTEPAPSPTRRGPTAPGHAAAHENPRPRAGAVR
jgi:hypothetical protein